MCFIWTVEVCIGFFVLDKSQTTTAKLFIYALHFPIGHDFIASGCMLRWLYGRLCAIFRGEMLQFGRPEYSIVGKTTDGRKVE